MKSLSSRVNGKGNFYSKILYLTMISFFVVTVVAIATPKMSNGTNNSIFGSFDSTGSSIILIVFPWLCLQYIKHLQAF